MNKNIKIKGKKHIKYLDKKKESMFKSQSEKMVTAYNNKEAEKCYQEVNTIRKGFKPKSYKDGLNIMRNTLNYRME
jgi:hypothetical protein